jgi:bacterioferritin-associated ferredoxin
MKNPEELVCLCFKVSQRKLINHMRVHQPKVASQLSDCGGAGTGCGWCVPYLDRLFQDSDSCSSSNESLSDLPDLIPEDYATQRQAYLKAGKKR